MYVWSITGLTYIWCCVTSVCSSASSCVLYSILTLMWVCINIIQVLRVLECHDMRIKICLNVFALYRMTSLTREKLADASSSRCWSELAVAILDTTVNPVCLRWQYKMQRVWLQMPFSSFKNTYWPITLQSCISNYIWSQNMIFITLVFDWHSLKYI